MRRFLAIPIVLCGLLLVSACTKPSSNGIASANGGVAASPGPSDDPNANLNFARCMREHGQNVPDPDPNGGDLRFDAPSGGQSSGWDAALQACRHFLPGGGVGPGPSAEDLEKLRAFAVCMRAHDIEVSDPDTTGDRAGNMIIGGRLRDVTRAQLEADPGYQAALAACQEKLPSPAPKKDGDR
jgi:hypothetical protein